MFGLFKKKQPCQSCGMPLSNDAVKGTNLDGSKSNEYCVHCYQNGSFTYPNCTVEQMVARVSDKMRSMYMPGFVIRHFVKDIPKLKRWN